MNQMGAPKLQTLNLFLFFYTILIIHIWWTNKPGLGSRSRSEPGVFGSLEPEPEPLEKKQEPEPLGKKSGAGASKKLAGSSAMREDKKHNEIVL